LLALFLHFQKHLQLLRQLKSTTFKEQSWL